MVKLQEDDIISNHMAFCKAYKESSSAPFLEDAFIAKSFPKIESLYKRTYPYDILLPKDMESLRRGDFNPERIIRVTEPFKGPYSNIWFGDSTEGVYLRTGYVDGNSSNISSFRLDDNNIHMLLGGATGQGKSVTLNDIIFGMCMEYAPWEIALTLSDAKIIEFKSYALQTPMPHIRSIAATDDADYLISVLQDLEAKMNTTNQIFSKAGVKKLEDFRKVTGLCYPRHILVVDEFQTMFLKAKKKASIINKVLDTIARQGRSSGFHIILSSQELGSDIDKNTLNQVKVRAAVGCKAEVSRKILGNDCAADNYGKKGRLIINASGGDDSEDSKGCNQHVRVPFMPDTQRISMGEFLINKGKEINYSPPLMFYDGESVLYEEDYTDYLKQFRLINNSVILGDASFVINGDEKIVRVKFEGDEVENMCILTPTSKDLVRYFKMLWKNFELHNDKAVHIMHSVDNQINKECSPKDLCRGGFYTDDKYFENNVNNVAIEMVTRRKLCLHVDKQIFETDVKYDSSFDEEFYKVFRHGSEYDTALSKLRFYVTFNILQSVPSYLEEFGKSGLGAAESKEFKFSQCRIVVETCYLYGAKETQLQTDDLPPIYSWIIGAHKMLGLGRDYKRQLVMRFKKMLQDSTDVNIRFILFTTTMENLEELLDGIRWFILDNPPNKEINKIKAQDDYPQDVKSTLGVLFDRFGQKESCVKFKKMFFNDEVPS